MKYFASGKMANVISLVTFLLGSLVALLLFNQGVSTYRSQAASHAQQSMQQFVARYDLALQQTIVRNKKLAHAIQSNPQIDTAQLNQFIQLVYPNPQDVAELFWLKNNSQASPIHFSPMQGLVELETELDTYIRPFIARAEKRNDVVVSPILDPQMTQSTHPLFIIVHPVTARPQNSDFSFIISVHRIASLTQALPNELNRTQYAYVLTDHERHPFAFPDNKMLADLPNVSLEGQDITYVSVPINIHGHKWHLWVYPTSNHFKSIPLIQYIYLGLALLGCLFVSLFLRYGLMQHRALYLRYLQENNNAKQIESDLHQAQSTVKKNNKTTEQTLSSKTQFMTTLSHQIRTPVNGIMGMTDLCLQTELTPKQQDYLRKIHVSAQHLNAVLGDLSDYALLESGQLTLQEHPFSLHEIVDGLYAMLSKEAQDKGLSFNITVPHTVHCDLIGDSRRIKEILLNLCINAIEHTTSGHIHLVINADAEQPSSAETSDYRLRFMISDTGTGFTQDDIVKLFSRSQPLNNHKNISAGLGLAISQALCQLMDGDIAVSSQLGIGSCFTAHINLQLNNLIITAPEQPKLLSKPQRIVVIDDNPISLTMLEHALTSMGASVTAYQFASDALDDLLGGEQPDVILLDWVMPQIGGLAFLTRLQQSENKITSRILILTAYDASSITRMSQHFPVERILGKPCRNEELFHIIEGPAPAPIFTIEENEPRLNNLVVLAAEDNMINQEIICELLEAEGATVIPANDGQHCLDELRRAQHVDIVLMDINMPVMDGLTALKHIRNELAMPDLPVVALTANIFEHDKAHYLQQGMNEHLGKPYDKDKIVECILNLTEHTKR
ncbi:response regulator [Paraglaciecola chathamensis]|uniref:response regulator n=1 Tax=Paraglaciecola chathamensis TaxID=368405 RepID=UPI0026FD7F1A|nr:response regulator [Paraglaciecola chathamensis]MDO6841482.1 response regulator [Paraglaciecola chathamensis]